MEDGQQDNPLMTLLEKHSGIISSLHTDVRDMSMDVLVLRAMVYGLMMHARETGVDLRPACMAIHEHLPAEHQHAFVSRLKVMYGIDIPV